MWHARFATRCKKRPKKNANRVAGETFCLPRCRFPSPGCNIGPSQNTPFPRWVQNGASVLMKQTWSHPVNKHVRISCSTASCAAKKIKARKGLCTIEDVSFSLLSKSVYHNGDDELQHLGSMKRKPGTGSNRNSGCMVMSAHVCQAAWTCQTKEQRSDVGLRRHPDTSSTEPSSSSSSPASPSLSSRAVFYG